MGVLAGQLAANEQHRSIERSACAASSSSTSLPAVGPLLQGKVALITGAGKGIGEAAARLMAAAGAAVVVADLDGAAASKVAMSIQEEGGRALAVTADVTAADAPARVVKEAVAAFGRLDVLVNNAGFTWDGVIHTMSAEQWDTMMLVHCTAPFRFIQAAAPYMRDAGKAEAASGGAPAHRAIINISSTTGTHGNAGQANYATAKAGVVGLTKAVAKEWGPFGVRCNAIAFGLIDTRLTRPKEQGEAIQVGGKSVALGIPQADNYWAQVKASIPLRRVGSAEEAAGAILALASPLSAYITGQVLEVNGGAFM